MTDDQKLREEHDISHEETLRALHETDRAIVSAQLVLVTAREKLRLATQKYEERLRGHKSA